jgi:hypothetical protein
MARHVRLLMQSGGEQTGYALRKFEIFGVPPIAPTATFTPPVPKADGTL